MKIENYVSPDDTFTWPNNPHVFDNTVTSNHQITRIGFQRHSILISGGGIAPEPIILTGQFNGSSRFTNYRLLSKHFVQTILLKKLYFESDKFYLGIGKQIKKTHVGTRTMFIDYIASFETIMGLLFGDTAKTSGTNSGNVDTYVTLITGEYDGAGDVTITDGLGNQVTIPSAAFAGKTHFKYHLVKMVDSGSGIMISEFAYFEVSATSGGTFTEVKTIATTSGFGILQLAAGANVSTIVFTNVVASPVVTFRDGYSD